MRNPYFLNRKDYEFRPFSDSGLSGNKQLAVTKKGNGASFVIKGGSRECACNEFIGLRLAQMLGASVPSAYLVEPKKNTYEVAIEYLVPMPKPDIDQVRNEEPLLRAYVYGVIAHCMFEDRDVMDFLFSDSKLYTFDFADGFRTDDIIISVMENASKLSATLPPEFMAKFISPAIDYQPGTLFAYEFLVNDQQVCDKAYFDAALDDMCTRCLTIPDEEITGMLNALGTQYPAALVNYFERYINEMRRFCQK